MFDEGGERKRIREDGFGYVQWFELARSREKYFG